MDKYLLRNFKWYCSWAADDAVECEEKGPGLLQARLKNGDIVLYDDMSQSARWLPADSRNLTEAQCRKEFGYRLQLVMARKCVNQQELSNRTGISTVSLSRYMTGKVSPTFYVVDRIAKALGCSTDDFRYF